MENRYIENFQVIVDEAHSQEHSVRWKAAVSDLRRIHPNLPDVAAVAAQKLPAADPVMLANRLSNTAPREIAGIGSDKMNDREFTLAVRRTHRSVSIQEAASHIIGEREGVAKASDFMSLKKAVDEGKQNQSGLVAIETLKRQGIEARRMLKDMTPAELKSVSVGAFDRVADGNKDRLTAALEIQSEDQAPARAPVVSAPVMRSARPQLSSPRRQPTFGRRMEAHRIAAGEAMAM